MLRKEDAGESRIDPSSSIPKGSTFNSRDSHDITKGTDDQRYRTMMKLCDKHHQDEESNTLYSG